MCCGSRAHERQRDARLRCAHGQAVCVAPAAVLQSCVYQPLAAGESPAHPTPHWLQPPCRCTRRVGAHCEPQLGPAGAADAAEPQRGAPGHVSALRAAVCGGLGGARRVHIARLGQKAVCGMLPAHTWTELSPSSSIFHFCFVQVLPQHPDSQRSARPADAHRAVLLEHGLATQLSSSGSAKTVVSTTGAGWALPNQAAISALQNTIFPGRMCLSSHSVVDS